MNARLRTSKSTSELHTIFTADGVISPAYPKTLQALIDLDGEIALVGVQRSELTRTTDKTAKQLLQEYGIRDITDSREKNVNRLMQFVGVVYQLVRGGS